MKHSVSRRLITMGLGVSLALGIVVLQSPAEAGRSDRYRVGGYRYSYRDVDRDGIPDYRDRFIRSSRYRYGRDYDRDGIRNKWDRDRDGDGIRNKRDRDKDGDGIRNRRDDHKKNPRRR